MWLIVILVLFIGSREVEAGMNVERVVRVVEVNKALLDFIDLFKNVDHSL
jgi:hypothetical protein